MEALFVANLLAWSLQVALIAATAALAAWLMPLDAAAVRHLWWRGVLALCLALPLLQPWAEAGVALSIDFSDASGDLALLSGTLPDGVGRLSWTAALPSWPSLLLIVLALGATVCLTRLSAGLVRLRRLRRTGTPGQVADADPELKAMLQARAEIRYADLRQPATFGFRRPVVLLPATLPALPPAVQRAVLAHELWHVRRRDWAWVLAEEIVRAVFWFHPAIWWLVSRVQSSREEVVDELTVLLTSSRRDYLEALLAFADEPVFFPATPFARRRHLFHRMLLISKEAVMSSKRIVASCATMIAALLLAGWYSVAAFPLRTPETPAAAAAGNQQTPPRDLRPGQARPATAREAELQKAIASPSATVSIYLELAKLQEERGALSEAESTLLALKRAHGDKPEAYYAVAGLYRRTGQFDQAVSIMEEAAALNPSDPRGQQVVATFYYERAAKDPALSPTEKLTYIQQGIAAADRALTITPEYVDALIYKNIFLRLQASLEADPSRQRALIAEADALRNRAVELRKANPEMAFVPSGAGRPGSGALPPPPPPPPPPGLDADAQLVDGKAPLRVGGTIKAPMKIRDVRPVYPPEARDAGIQGVVIIEATVDAAGLVRSARVLRSIPLLDQAALDAVSQWQFTAPLMNGEPVPVIMTVTVNFTLQ